jgi:predicted MPP superfamily phosphohydrolase
MHVPFAAAVAHHADARATAWSVFVAFVAIVVPTWLLSGRFDLLASDHPISRVRTALELAYFVHWGATALSVPLVAAIALAALLAPDAWACAVGDLCALAYGVGLALSGWGVLVRRRWVRVRHLTVPVSGLPSAFEGYRIAQLSDLHVGSFCSRERAATWVERANALEPDLVALTGDYATSGTRFHADIATTLSALRARDGVLAVMGNHDYYDEGQPLLSLLDAAGILVLHNQAHALRREDQELLFAGVDDFYTRRANVEVTMQAVGTRRPVVVLAHDPLHFDALADAGAAVVLSGHTHAGQLAVPFLARSLNIARILNPYHAGEARRGDATLVISAGLGTTGPPLRLGAAPEILMVQLVAGASRIGGHG